MKFAAICDKSAKRRQHTAGTSRIPPSTTPSAKSRCASASATTTGVAAAGKVRGRAASSQARSALGFEEASVSHVIFRPSFLFRRQRFLHGVDVAAQAFEFVGNGAQFQHILDAFKEFQFVNRLAQVVVATDVVIGGAVVTEDYAWEIGADGYSSDAANCVRVVKRLMEIAG